MSMLWKIKKEGLRDNYLLGTLHCMDPRVATPKNHVKEVLCTCDRAVFEMDFSSFLNDFFKMLGKSIISQEEGDLKTLLGVEVYKKIVPLISRFGFSESYLIHLKPWFVFFILSNKLMTGYVIPWGMPMPIFGDKILDIALFDIAKNYGKQVYCLETVEDMIALFEQMPGGDILEIIQESLKKEDPTGEVTSKGMIDTYLANDFDKLTDLENKFRNLLPGPAYNRFYKRLNDDRNHTMAQRSAQYLYQGSTFIAIGACHLPGPNGVIELLKGEGFQLSPL